MSLIDLLVPWPERRILYEDAQVLAIDKPSGWVVHGGDQSEPSDVVTRLGAWLRGRGSDSYLGVHQRLDQDASGVMLFTRSPVSTQDVGRAFREHRLERRYTAVVSGELDGEGTFHDRLAYDKAKRRSRLVDRGGVEAVARYRVIDRVDNRALVELFAETGRTHQLRVQLSSRGAPIAGDRFYGGAAAPRLMLHACSLDLPAIGRRFESAVPQSFIEWLRAGVTALGAEQRLTNALLDAASRRWPLRNAVTGHRLVDGAADDFPGVTVDRYDDFVVLGCRTEAAEQRADAIARLLEEHGARGIYAQTRPRADLRRVSTAKVAPATPIRGQAAPDRIEVREGPCRLWIYLGDGLSTGLFADQRRNRELVASRATGGRVLNLFAYTGAFTVACALAGARESVSVDTSRRALERLHANLELNGLSRDAHRTVREDAIAWVQRAGRRRELFDVIVLDPPSFATRGARTFSVQKDYRALCESCLRILKPGGHLLAVTNHRGTRSHLLSELVRTAASAAGHRVERLAELSPPIDFPDRPDGSAPTKSVLLTTK